MRVDCASTKFDLLATLAVASVHLDYWIQRQLSSLNAFTLHTCNAIMAVGLKFPIFFFQRLTLKRLGKTTLSHLQRGTSDLLGGPKAVFRGLVSPRNCPIMTSISLSHFWWFSCCSSRGKQWMILWNLASTVYSYAYCLQTAFS